MADLGLSNGYCCVVEQDDMFKFLIDYGSLEKPWGKGFLNGRLFPCSVLNKLTLLTYQYETKQEDG